MNWRRDLFRFWSCSRCAGLFAVSVFPWRWVLASSQEFVFADTPPTPIKAIRSHLTWTARWWRSTAGFCNSRPTSSKETVEEIVNHLNAETAKRYAVYRSSPMLSTVISGSSHLCDDQVSLLGFLHLLGCEPNKTEIIK
jgi:hypothetical protein